MTIRKATHADLSRIAEIFVFNNRINFFPIFKDEGYSFGDLQVVSLADGYFCEVLQNLWVFDDGLIRGFLEMKGRELHKLYVDPFFQSRGIGGCLIAYAVQELRADHLWALEKNTRAIGFYESHGFRLTGEKQLEEDTMEYLVKLGREMVNIRPATKQDTKALAYVQTESWKSAFQNILSEEDLLKRTGLEKTEAMYGRVLQNPGIRVLLEEVEGRPHCMAAWGPNRADLGETVAELICIHSLPDKWRQGYGSMMMDRILADIREAGFSEVMLWVFEQNQRARKFYEKHGFSLTERTQNNFGAVELMYTRKL